MGFKDLNLNPNGIMSWGWWWYGFRWNSLEIAVLENLNLKDQKFEKKLSRGENKFLWKLSYFYQNIYIEMKLRVQ